MTASKSVTTDAGTTVTPLTDAFKLYETGNEPAEADTGVTTPAEGVSYKAIRWETGKDQIRFDHLPDGVYTLSELSTPTGYRTFENYTFRLIDGKMTALTASEGYENNNTMNVVPTDKKVGADGKVITEASLKTPFSYLEEMEYQLIKTKKYKTNMHVFVRKIQEQK